MKFYVCQEFFSGNPQSIVAGYPTLDQAVKSDWWPDAEIKVFEVDGESVAKVARIYQDYGGGIEVTFYSVHEEPQN